MRSPVRVNPITPQRLIDDGSVLERLGNLAAAILILGWTLLCGLVLRRAVFATNDSISNYAHVWYVSRQIWHYHRIPFHMPIVGHGKAYAFPYAFVPWASAALLRPLLGDWTVTLWLVIGAIGLLTATFWSFPELRRGWWAACILASPMIVAGVVLGQLPFLWAIAMLFFAIGSWRRNQFWLALILATLAQITHPAVLMPITGLLVMIGLHWESSRKKLLLFYGLSVFLAAPAAWLVLTSPVVEDTTTRTQAINFIGTVVPRATILLLPFVLLWLQRFQRVWVPIAMFGALIAGNFMLMPIIHTGDAARKLDQRPNTALVPYLDSNRFVPGATYRLLRIGDDKLGMYEILQHGGRLDSEFFPESIDRQSWPNTADYAAFLRKRDVGFVVINYGYDIVYQTNEHRLLEQMIASPVLTADGSMCVELYDRMGDLVVYRIRDQCRSTSAD